MTILNANLIMTVKSNIPAVQLGFCHSHEHLFIANGHSAKIVPSLRIDDFNKTVAELNLFRNSGGSSIIDAQPVGCGRMAELLLMASIQSDVNVIASTGFHKLIFYPENHWIKAMDEDELITVFKSEIELGMYIGCDDSFPSARVTSRAGIIKTASDIEGLTGDYKKYFIAAAKTSGYTGVPILSHTEMGKGAMDQIELFALHGLETDSIILCHLDRVLDDINYQIEVAKSGVFMEFDTIGRFKYHSDEAEAEFILKMVELGYEDKILLGLDCTRERMKSYGGSLGLDYLNTTFIPLLKTYGLTDEIIKKFTIYNPAKAFTIKKRI